MTENERLTQLQDLGYPREGPLHDRYIGAVDSSPFQRPPDEHRIGGVLNEGHFVMGKAPSVEEQISEAFKKLAQLVATLPDNDSTQAARYDLTRFARNVSEHFIELDVYPNGKPKK